MPGRITHRGWIVLESLPSDDGERCVDFFEDPASGRFGYELFRSDPEDVGRWTPIGGAGSTRFDSIDQAVAAAVATIGWLRGDSFAATALAAWIASLEQG